MSMPPPPPGPPNPQGPQGYQPPGYQPPGYQPPGYQPYGMQPAPQANSGMAVASLVLSLVGLIPCFWFFQVPGLLGTIFGFVGMKQTGNDAQRGRGMAIAGVVIGLILLAACVAFWIYVFANGNCHRVGGRWYCNA